MTKLSIGIQTFRKLREGGYAYADKTSLIERLAREGQFYFLARPRRFGKSLLVTTLADAFAGHRELFTGLYLETHWDWERRHPVLRLDFGEGILSTTALLDATVALQLAECAQAYGVTLTQEPIHLRLHELIHALHARTGERVVVLVDEYDKPILDHLDRSEVALALRESLRNLYSVLKSQDAHLRFVLLTGVSKFSKVSLFSGLNNLKDITLDGRFATLCGYTQGELESAFADHLAGVDLAEVKQWYNGYNFLGEPVYNPFDVLLYLDSHEFRPWWFETGTPTFLIKLLQTRRYNISDLENLETGEELLGSFDVDGIEPEALLFQTGYLTIRERYRRSGLYRYRLRYPNFEVRTSLPAAILNAYVPSVQDRLRTEDRIYAALEADEPDGLYRAFHAFFASIPHDWYRRNAIADYEGYWASVVYCYFAALGLAVTPEDATNRGRIDLSIRFAKRVYLLEFKVVESSEAGGALEQLRARGYAEKFAGLPVTLIGMEFSREQRNLVGFEWARG
ncbi:MAG: AAA family ATPase [Candidatus Contendobacter sp.]|nr:AAA family ATPase [Candidatus Contendobacter sp.]MDG4559537.1 AAA family ATPase [Candidatus Contendobacter sp.]